MNDKNGSGIQNEENKENEEEVLIKQPWTKTWGKYFFPCRFGQSERLIYMQNFSRMHK